jgi:hypothetical protein|tara:strand:+ start:104 stop:289 length:186 start_codon:yes stop_codon:yes gene_type:complete
MEILLPPWQSTPRANQMAASGKDFGKSTLRNYFIRVLLTSLLRLNRTNYLPFAMILGSIWL